MSIGCITRGASILPDPIIDTSTMSLTYDNQGMVNLQVAIITKQTNPFTSACVTANFNGGTFRGFLQSDSPRRLEGTDYYEHTILARGMVC
jgi:hypothetical protein